MKGCSAPPGMIQGDPCADTCPPSGVVANLPDIIYFQANVTFADSVAIQDADVASFSIATSAPDEPGQCPCGLDEVKSQRMSSPQGRDFGTPTKRQAHHCLGRVCLKVESQVCH